MYVYSFGTSTGPISPPVYSEDQFEYCFFILCIHECLSFLFGRFQVKLIAPEFGYIRIIHFDLNISFTIQKKSFQDIELPILKQCLKYIFCKNM